MNNLDKRQEKTTSWLLFHHGGSKRWKLKSDQLVVESLTIDKRPRHHQMYIAVPAKDAIRTLTHSLTDAGMEIESHISCRDSLTYSINCKRGPAIMKVLYA